MAAVQNFVHGQLCQMPLADLHSDPDQPCNLIDPVVHGRTQPSQSKSDQLNKLTERLSGSQPEAGRSVNGGGR